MKLETWMYKQALELYPKAYREQFGEPMLETYTDGLRAAKLEGEVFEFHKHTIADTLKGIWRASNDIERPDLLARSAVVFMVLYALYFIVAMSFPAIFMRQTGFQIAMSLVYIMIFLAGFVIASRRAFSEWIYFAMMSVGETLRFVIGVYLTTFNSFGRNFPDYFYTVSTIQSGLGWGILLIVPLAIFLRSREQKRLSRMIWYFAFLSIITFGYFFIPAPQTLRTEFHMFDVLNPLYLLSKLGLLAFFALKFWQRTRPEPRVIKTT